jgi:uncharacterized protein (DUF1501 family)
MDRMSGQPEFAVELMMKRRSFLQQSAALASLSFAGFPSAWGQGQAGKPRLLVVLLRGGMDGLTAVPPVGDAQYNTIRPQIAVQNTLSLTADFGLHPKLEAMHSMWQAGQLAVVHSTGFQYTGRSHFEGQDIMQTGVMKPYASSSGWIGRAMEQAKIDSGVAISIPMPLILRGHDKATTQFPNWMPTLRDQDLTAVVNMWSADPALSPYSEVIREANLGKAQGNMNNQSFQDARSMRGLARTAAASMRLESGPQVGLIDMTHGFDTHASQGAEQGSHADKLRDLDQLMATFRTEMGEQWANTVVLTITEFGRTAAENGTNGTDHGVGSCCFLAGGLVTQAKVYSDWRGLAKSALFEERDLPTTIDVSAVHAKVLERVFALSPKTIANAGVLDYKTSPLLNGLLGV